MQNTIICKSCGTENPYYESICKKCSSYLRDKIFNIDLWKTIAGIIETPVTTFGNIIRSEHKNFISLIFITAVFKLFISTIFISLVFFRNENAIGIFFSRFLLFAGGCLVLLLIAALVLLFIIKNGGVKARFKDLFALLTFSLLPYSFAALFLFPIEIIIFGGDLFSVNPSPFIIKSFIAWSLAILEFALILWSLFLVVTGLYAQTRSKTFSLISSIIFYIIVYSTFYFYSFYLSL